MSARLIGPSVFFQFLYLLIFQFTKTPESFNMIWL